LPIQMISNYPTISYDDAKDKLKVMIGKTVGRVRQTYTTQVNATNGVDTQTFLATAGCIARLLHLGIYIPAIAGSTRNHSIHVTLGTNDDYEEERLFSITIFGTSDISIKTEDSWIYKDIVFDSTTPLQVKYLNTTNTNQTGTRFIYLIYQEEAVI